ncbi:MAG TPA: polymer-forming cytoskeletal protein, partial [Bacillota bacterium]|nr:polymer-forming cytoskeletal protein [Bacillota bacterium]
VNGDARVRMGRAEISGTVRGDLRADMGEIRVEGLVTGDVRGDLGSIRIDGTVGGDVNSSLGEVIINGTVEGSVFSEGKRVIIAGTVGGDVNVTRGIVELKKGARVEGEVAVERGLVRQGEGAEAGSIRVEEELSEEEIDTLFRSKGYFPWGLDKFMDLPVGPNLLEGLADLPRFLPRMGFYWSGWRGATAYRIVRIAFFFALSALVYALFPRQVETAARALETKTGAAALAGILAALLILPVLLILLLTIIGIPLIPVALLLLAAAWFLGFTGIALWLGERLARAMGLHWPPLAHIAAGVLVVGLVGLLPVLGTLLGIALFVFAVGSALVTRLGTSSGEALLD